MFSCTPSMNSATTPFGPQFVFGQSSVPASTSSVTSFGSSTGASVFGGASAGVFGASASPLSSTFTTPSSPAFGCSSSASMNSSTSAFGPQYVFGQSSHLNVPTSPFGSQYILGQSSNPNGAEVSAPTIGVAPFGSQEGMSVFGGASTGVFGATASPLSSTSTLATTSSPAIWGSSSGFGGGEARLPTFGIIDSEQSTFGVIRGESRVTSYTETAEVDGAQIAGRLMSISAMHAHKDKCHEELRWEDYMLADTGTQVRISTCDGIGSGQSALGNQYLGSKFATYTGTLELNGGSSAGSLLSLSAMPVYQNRSHEELRWEDHQLKNRGEFGVGPAGLQLNPFSNPLSRSDNSSLNPISSSITSNIFAPRTPSFSFPSSEVCTPAFSWPPLSTSSIGNSIWTTTSSKPPCIAVMTGSNSSPSLSGPFSSHTYAPSPSLASSVSSTCHSSENPFTSTPSNPFLHSFTSVFGGASTGVFGATASPLSSTSTLATTSSPAIWGSSSGFGGGEAKLPTFGIIDSEQSTFGVIRGGSRVTSYTGTAEVDSAQIAGRLVSISAMHAHKDKCHEELRWEDYKLGDTGTQVRISTCDGISSGQSALGSEYLGSKPATYTGTLEVNGGSNAGSLLSLSAMPIYQNRSHEELRWKDHQLKNRGEFGVGPVCLQSNPFSNPLSRSDNSSLNPISSSITSNIFAPRMPSFSFPSSEVSTPAFSWPPFSTSSFGNSLWTTSSSKPPCTAVMAGSNSSPSLSGPFSSPTFALSPSLVSSLVSTCHSSENPFTSTPSNPFLHPFTSAFGGASTGVFGATASPLSSTSTLATTSSPAIWGSSSGFGGGEARLPTFGIIDSEQSTFGVICGGSRVTSYTGTAEVDGAQIAGRLVSISAMIAHKDKCHEELRWEDYKLGDKGTQVRISTCDGIGSGQSAFGSQYLGSKLATYTRTLELNGGSSAGSLLSLSAMPVYQYRSHEELRWEDHQLKNRGEFGVGPACLQSNPFSNPLSKYDNSSLNPISSSITSYIFSPRTPSFSFPSYELSTPSFSWPPFSASSFGNSNWTTSASKPPCTAVIAGSNSSPSLSGPFSSPTFGLSPSLASSVSPKCHSSANPFTSTPSCPFLHQNSSAFTVPAFSTLSTANSFLDKSRVAPTSLTQSVPQFGPSTFSSFSSRPPTSTAYTSTASFISSSAPGTTSFGPNLNYTSTSFAPSPSICSSTYITASHAALVPDNSTQYLLAPSLSPPPPSISSCTVAPGTASRPSPSFSFVEIMPSVTQKSSLSKQITSCPSGNPNTFTFPSTTPGFKPSFPNPFQQEQTSQTGVSNGIDGITEVGGQITSAQQFPYQSTDTMKQSPVASPFRTLPTVPQMSTDGPRATPVVSEKPYPVRSSSLLTIRHLNQLPTPKCNPKRDGPKLPFFSDAHMTPSIAKAETLLPRENPSSLVIGPTEEWNLMANFENSSVVKHTSIHVFENGNVSVKVSAPIVDGSLSQNKDGNSDQTSTSKSSAASAEHSHKLDGVHDDHQAPRGDSAIFDEPALKIIYSFSSTGFSGGADVMKLMPKLRHTDYYVEPRIEELAVKESSKSGFCSHVKDFVVGRLGYGSIMFLGETDVRELDIESHIQFNEREVVVYMDETKKPPVGQGLNKPAEITLCNIKCIDKKTGKQYIDGPKVDKYKETLMKKTAEQGAEFVSYDPVQGDWKFKVQHF